MTCSTARAADSFSSDGVVVSGNHNATIAQVTGTQIMTMYRGLEDDTTYEIVIRAITNGEGDSLWSSPGTGRTNRANHDPIFR